MITKLITPILYTMLLCSGIMASGFLTPTPTPVYQEIRVRSGDTLWSLAATYAEHSSTDIREVIYHIRKVNQLASAADLRPGMVLRIPVAVDAETTTESVYIAQQ